MMKIMRIVQNLRLMITVMFGQIMRPHILMKQILKF